MPEDNEPEPMGAMAFWLEGAHVDTSGSSHGHAAEHETTAHAAIRSCR
jgi:hypothetical protein